MMSHVKPKNPYVNKELVNLMQLPCIKQLQSEIKPFAKAPKNLSNHISVNNMEQIEVKAPLIEQTDDLPKDSIVWPKLSIENINTTFKVIGDIKEGIKLKIVEDKYLTEDNSYFPSLTREVSYRSRIISFLRHLFEETERHTGILLSDIKQGKDVDENISELENMISNMMVFLHKYDTMRNVYKSDAGSFATLGVIRNRFFTFRNSLFRKLALKSVC